MKAAAVLKQIKEAIRKVTKKFKFFVDDLQQPYEIDRSMPFVISYLNLAKKMGKREGSTIRLYGSEFEVVGILGMTGAPEDLALFLQLEKLQNLTGLPKAVNEVRLYPRTGTSSEKIKAFLRTHYPQMNVIDTSRGETAEQEIGDSLRKHRWIVYVITALTVALCTFIASYLNARERWIEMATLVAVGSTGMMVSWLLLARAVILGLFGTLIGFLLGFILALLQDFESTMHITGMWSLFITIMGMVVGFSALGAVPASVTYALKQHVAALQE